jgi:hypothetical protein
VINVWGKTIRVANCHLLGGSSQDKGREQIEELVQEVEQPSFEQIDARIIKGDFNADEKQLHSVNSKLEVLENAHYQFDGNITPTEIGKNRHIDWIWVHSSSAKLTSLQNGAQLLGNRPSQVASDHALLATQITFQATSLKENPFPSILPKAHSQPKGSFREKIINHFSVTGWDAALRGIFANKLDEILTGLANVKPFLLAVRQKFQEYVNTLYMTEEGKQILMNDLERAIKTAEQVFKKPGVVGPPPSLKPNPIHTPPSPPPLLPISPSPVLDSAPMTFFQHIRNFFYGFVSFFARLFGFR